MQTTTEPTLKTTAERVVSTAHRQRAMRSAFKGVLPRGEARHLFLAGVRSQLREIGGRS